MTTSDAQVHMKISDKGILAYVEKNLAVAHDEEQGFLVLLACRSKAKTFCTEMALLLFCFAVGSGCRVTMA